MKQKLDIFAERALSTKETVYNSYELAKRCFDEGIFGDFVECGVFCGSQVAAMSLAGPRTIHLFDSFTGIPKAGSEDGVDGTKIEGKSVCSSKEVRRHMIEWGVDPGLLVYHEGLFKDTVPGFDRKIALLRLDGDLYRSTKVCLEHLYPLLEVGGYLIIDDYSLPGCHMAVTEYMSDEGFIKVEGGMGVVYMRKTC